MERPRIDSNDQRVEERHVWERSPITLADLVEDNNSLESGSRSQAWRDNRDDKKLIALGTCGDSRVLIPNPEQTSAYHTIAAGGQIDLYIPIIMHDNTSAGVELVHYAGSTVMKGMTPEGCGGLKAKSSLGNGFDEHRLDISAYIKNPDKVAHPDPIIHGCITAARIAEYTEKPILAAAMDHETMSVVPLALFTNYGRNVLSAVNMRHLFEGQYNPDRLYENDVLPSLEIGSLPDSLAAYLYKHEMKAAQLRAQIPDLAQRMHSQNPFMLDISNDNRPFGVSFPRTSDPGIAFKLRLARCKDNTGRTILPKGAIEEIIQEVDYPVTHFDNLKTILIRTGDLADSKEIGEILAQQEYMKPWLQTPGNRFIYARTHQGKLIEAKENVFE